MCKIKRGVQTGGGEECVYVFCLSDVYNMALCNRPVDVFPQEKGCLSMCKKG